MWFREKCNGKYWSPKFLNSASFCNFKKDKLEKFGLILIPLQSHYLHFTPVSNHLLLCKPWATESNTVSLKYDLLKSKWKIWCKYCVSMVVMVEITFSRFWSDLFPSTSKITLCWHTVAFTSVDFGIQYFELFVLNWLLYSSLSNANSRLIYFVILIVQRHIKFSGFVHYTLYITFII